MGTTKQKLLGELLVEKKIITTEQLGVALTRQKETGEMLGHILVQLGFIDQEATLLPIIAEQHGIPCVNLQQIEIPFEVIKKIPARFARRKSIIPIAYHNNIMTVAMVTPFDVLLQDEIRLLFECDVKAVLASKKDIMTAINKHYGVGTETIEEIVDQTDIKDREVVEVVDLEKIGSEATISNFLNQVILNAYKENASDIHVEPQHNKLIIRYRVDGILRDINVPKEIHYFRDHICSRIKIMSSLDIAEKRMPQDGRFATRVGDIDLDLRVSILPTLYGESTTIRILNTTRLFKLGELGLSKSEEKLIIRLIKGPNGIIFVTGPTGSGKTTTLYSCLSHVNTRDKQIITLEDPVEYQLGSITQIQVNQTIDMSFARGLRSILRHDPDIIMVGEVRDVETAEIVIQAALTGHLIFSTLHTNDAASGITRLLNMGIEPYLIISTVECFIAQRLVRVNCPHCKKPRKLSVDMMKEFHLEEGGKSELTVYESKGCQECNQVGVIGRTPILEILIPNEEINEMILNRATAGQIKKKAVECGMKTLRQSGWEKVKAGITTPEEVIRVTQGRTIPI